MSAAQKMMDVITHNLANASTNGFKQDGLAFSDAFNHQLRAGGRTIGAMSFGPELKTQFTDFSVGSISPTSNPLDLAIPTKEGLFAVETPNGVRYTRDGSFTLNDGRLTTRQGLPVLDDRGQPIDVPPGALAIGTNGAVTVDGAEVGAIGVFTGTFTHEGGNLFAGANASAMTEPKIRVGALEGSNVNPLASMVSMVGIHRIFELSQRAIAQQDELTQRLIQSLQDR